MSLQEELEHTESSTTEEEEYSDSEDEGILKGLSEKQRKLFQERLDAAQKQFIAFNSNQRNQKIQDVQNHVTDIDDASAELAIKACRGNELLAIKRLLEDDDFKQAVKEMSSGKREVDMEEILYRDKRQEMREALSFDPDIDSDNDEEEYNGGHKVHHRTHKSHPVEEGSDPEIDEPHEKGERRCPRLCLDDALILLANLGTSPAGASNQKEASKKKNSRSPSETTSDQSDKTKPSENETTESETTEIPSKKRKVNGSIKEEKKLFLELSGSKANKVNDNALRQLGWSEARIKAFKNREKNPNQYYYRFNDPGEPQATGKWSPKDKALFMKLIQEKGVDYQWGLFSMNIPGRVGYQCSNYYRQLIKQGQIKDDNYYINSEGKLTFRFKNSQKQQETAEKTTTRKRQHRRTKTSTGSDEEEEIVENEPEPNVLPDYIDPMTMMPVVKPAISPYGHVMGYDSWVKVLNRDPKNTCPFTKKRLTRRSLVKLTYDNIDEYRDKIISTNGFEAELHC